MSSSGSSWRSSKVFRSYITRAEKVDGEWEGKKYSWLLATSVSWIWLSRISFIPSEAPVVVFVLVQGISALAREAIVSQIQLGEDLVCGQLRKRIMGFLSLVWWENWILRNTICECCILKISVCFFSALWTTEMVHVFAICHFYSM